MNGFYRNGVTCRKDGRNDKEKPTRLAWHLEEQKQWQTKVKIKERTLTFSNSRQQITRMQEIGCAHFLFLSLVADPTRHLWTDNWVRAGLWVSGRRWRLCGNVHPAEFFLAALICWLRWCDFMRTPHKDRWAADLGGWRDFKKKKEILIGRLTQRRVHPLAIEI